MLYGIVLCSIQDLVRITLFYSQDSLYSHKLIYNTNLYAGFKYFHLKLKTAISTTGKVMFNGDLQSTF